MLKSIVSSPYVNMLQTALGASALRQQVISDNIANVNTPGFKRSEVSFENRLNEVLEASKKPSVIVRTHEKHFPVRINTNISPEINTITQTSLRVDGNNVDIDAEMAEMAKNNIYYNALVQKTQSYFSNLKNVISGGR